MIFDKGKFYPVFSGDIMGSSLVEIIVPRENFSIELLKLELEQEAAESGRDITEENLRDKLAKHCDFLEVEPAIVFLDNLEQKIFVEKRM